MSFFREFLVGTLRLRYGTWLLLCILLLVCILNPFCFYTAPPLVAKLNPPWASSLPKEFSIDCLPMSPALSDRPYGRYFAEWWLLNDLAEAFWTFPVLHRERDTWKMGSQNDTATAVRQAHSIEPSGCEHPKEPMLTKYGKLVKEKEWPALCPASEGNYSMCHTSLIEPG